MKSHALSRDEVDDRVKGYSSNEVTNELYRFGTMLLNENIQRTNHLESKATSVVGYSVAVLAFLISRPPVWVLEIHGPLRLLVVAAGFLTVFAIAISFCSLLISTYKWFSDSQWFENEEGLLEDEDADRLKRYYILAMHRINQQIGEKNSRKADRILLAQILLGGAGLCLAIAFSMYLLSHGLW